MANTAAETKKPFQYFWLAMAGLTAIHIALCFFSLRDVPLVDPDEPRYAGTGRTMYEGGSWLVPEFNGEPRINKPPLFYWLVAISAKVCGTADEVSARLPSIVLSLLMLWGTALLGRAAFSPATGILAALILGSSPYFIIFSRWCITDMTLSAFMAGSMTVLMLGMLGLLSPKKTGLLATPLLGFAVLTKAIAALSVTLAIIIERALSLEAGRRPKALRFLPLLLGLAMACSFTAEIFDNLNSKERRTRVQAAAAAAGEDETPMRVPRNSVYHTLDENFKRIGLLLSGIAVAMIVWTAVRAGLGPLREMHAGWCLAAAIAMGAWWYAMLIYHYSLPNPPANSEFSFARGWLRFRELLEFEVAGRLAGDVHRQPMHYYLLHIFATAFPWSFALLGSLALAWRKSDAPEFDSRESRADRFLLAWVLGIVLFFSIPNAKVLTYILPASPAVALLIARFLMRLAEPGLLIEKKWRVITIVFAACYGSVLALASPLSQFFPQEYQDVAALLSQPVLTALLVLGIAFLAAWLLLSFGRIKTGAPLLAALLVTLTFVIVPALGIPRLNARSHRDLNEAIGTRVKDCPRFASLGVDIPSLSYYFRHPVARLEWKPPGDSPRDQIVRDELEHPERTLVFIDKRYVQRMYRRELKKLSRDEITNLLPENAEYVFNDAETLVIRRK